MQREHFLVRYDERMRSETYSWMSRFDSYLTHACTFTFHQSHTPKPEDAWGNWQNFCKFLNRRIYKHAAKRYGKTLLILPVLHGELTHKRLHFHAALGCIDRDYSFVKLGAIINSCWRDMQWAQNVTDIKPYENAGWIDYMLHESLRLDLNSLDLTRCFIPNKLTEEVLS